MRVMSIISLIVLLLLLLSILALPTIVGKLGRPRMGMWIGLAEFLVILLPIGYWIGRWMPACLAYSGLVIGEEVYDNDTVCRMLSLDALTIAFAVLVWSVFLLPQIWFLRRQVRAARSYLKEAP
jgi:hypothetical protein